MDIVGHLQSVGPEVGLDGLRPPVAGVDHHCAGQVLQVPDPFLRNAILEMGIGPTVGDGLSARRDVGHKFVLGEAAVVGMVAFDLDAMGGAVGLELAFAQQGLVPVR